MNSDSLQIQVLESKVQLLQGKMDSINQLLTNQALQYEVNKQVEIVDKIDGLYNNAMSDILWIVGGGNNVCRNIDPFVNPIFTESKL